VTNGFVRTRTIEKRPYFSSPYVSVQRDDFEKQHRICIEFNEIDAFVISKSRTAEIIFYYLMTLSVLRYAV